MAGLYESRNEKNKPASTSGGGLYRPYKEKVDEIRMAPLKFVERLNEPKETPEERAVSNAIRMQPLKFSQGLQQQVDVRKAAEAKAAKAEEVKRKAELKASRVQKYASDPPVIRDIHRGLDKFADFVRPATDFAESTGLVPGAGIPGGNIISQGAGFGLSKLAPALSRTATGRIGTTAAGLGAEGAITGAGATLAATGDEREALQGAAFGGVGGLVLGGLGRGIGELVSKNTRDLQRQLGGVAGAIDAAMKKEYPTRLTSPGALKQLDEAMTRIKPIVTERMTPPLENTNELAKWIQTHAGMDDLSLNEIRKLPYEDMRQLAEDIRPQLNTATEAYKAAQELGYDLPALLEGQGRTISQRASQDASRRAYGIYPESLPDVRRNVTSKFDARRQELGITQAAEPTVARPTSEPEVLASAPEKEAQETLQRVQEPRIRDRVYNFLDDAEKAARERLAKRRNIGFMPQGGNDVVDYSIIGAAKLGKGTIKFSDWTEEMVKEFGEGFRKQAPRIYQQSKEYLRQQERRASKKGQEALAFNESGVGDASTFDAKISRGPSKRKESIRQKWERIRTQLVDDLAPLEGLEKRVRGRVASAEDSLYKAARLFKGVPEKAAQTVTQRLTPIVEMVEKAGYTSDDLGRYALAKHAKDVNAAGYKSGFTNKEIDDVLQRYGTPEMDAAQQALVKVNRDMLEELVNNGVVSRELAETLNERWKNYIPLFRSFDDEKVDFEGGFSKALANVASPIKSLQGSERAVIDPLENMIKNIYRSTNAAERNKVASQLTKLANIDKDGQFIRELKDKHFVTVRKDGNFKRYYIDKETLDKIPDMEKDEKHALAKRLAKDDDVTFAQSGTEKEEVGRKNVVNVKVNGENVKYEVEPEVYKALLNLDQESSNMIVNILSKPASLLRAGATLTPEFSLRNPIRDVLQAFVVSKSGFNPITDFGAGLIQAISKGKLYREWVDNLGAYGNVMSMDRKVHQQALEKVLGEAPSKKFVNIINGKSLIRLLRAISDTTESATKIGEYRAALRKGVSKQEAAYRSRDIMDFGRAGTGIRQANKIVAFLNANIQGKSKLIRAIKENPAGTLTRAFTAVTLPTVGFYAWNKYNANEVQRETLDNAPDWLRDSFWLVAVPGTDTVARIPKPFDLATLFSNLPERALDYVYKNDKQAFDGFMGRSLQENSIPVQISGILPIIEGMANYSFFRQGSIIPQRESNLAFSDQYDPVRTTETAKLLASGAEKLTGGKGAFANFSSPRIMDNTIQGLTAGLGKYATDAVDSILMGKVPFTGKKVAPAIVERPEAPSPKTEQRPLLRSFLVDPTQGGKAMDKFYETLDELSKEKSSNKLNDRVFGGTRKKPEYLPREKEELLKSLNKSSTEVSDINKQIREIEKSMTLTPREKRKQIDALMEERMKIVKDAVALLK